MRHVVRRTVRAVPVMFAMLCGTSVDARGQTAFPAPPDKPTQLLMQRLSALSVDSMEGRRAGSEGSRRARRWIVGQLTAMGVQPAGATFEQAIPAGHNAFVYVYRGAVQIEGEDRKSVV